MLLYKAEFSRLENELPLFSLVKNPSQSSKSAVNSKSFLIPSI